MFKRLLVGSTLCILFSYSNCRAQSVCPLDGTLSNKLVCVIPQTFGARGLGPGEGAPLKFNFGHEGHFDSDFISSFGPINEAVGIQVSQLPIASPSSSITFTYDPALKTFAPSTEQSLGPILGERANTIGRRRLYVAFSFQYFNFNSIDGQNTSDIPAVFKHLPVAPNTNPSSPTFLQSCQMQSGLTGSYAGDPCFVRDFIQSTNNIDLTVHQYTLYATYGITRHLDFSVAIPILNVRMKVDSNATIVQNSFGPGGSAFHQFDPTIVTSCGSSSPCLNGTFNNSSGSASGIGDIVLRGKYELYHGEHFGVAAGVDVRLPTGDEQNFLGSGAVGVRPFGVVSYDARISPHAEVGYEVNGQSILAGNFVATNTNTKGDLPHRFVYIVGADASIVKRLTASFDIYGQRLFGVPQLFSSPFTDFGKCSDINCTTLTPGTTHLDIATRNVDYNIMNASVGLKYRLFSHLVFTGNVLLKLNDSGLRTTAVPLVGLSYSF